MGDYIEEEVTDFNAAALGSLIRQRIQNYPSVQVIRKGKKIMLRTWRVEFEVENAVGEQL